MTITEINPLGNFDSWDQVRLEEINEEKFSKDIGEILYESSEFKLWQIVLKPFERLPFRIHTNNYSCTSLSDGLALSRNINGTINLMRFRKGAHFFLECYENPYITDFENVGEAQIKLAILEEIVETSPQIKNKF